MHPLEQIETILGTPTKENPQLFENRGQGGADDTAYEVRGDKFANTRKPNLGIKEEKSQHLVVILLKAQGKSQREISEITGLTQPWVSQILRQPWAKTRLLDALREAGQDAVSGRLKQEALESVERVIELRDSPTAPAAVKLAAANSLLDRHLGKAVQKTENFNHNIGASGFEDVEVMRERLAKLVEKEVLLTNTKRN